jgi:flavin reductase (DIM6/NTAB) family NADH-FMN oxidoreductase RutF/rubredoxin
MDTNALFKLSYGLYVVGVKTDNGLGGCIVDTAGQVAAGDNPLVTLACQKKNYTNECIKKTGEFTLSVLSVNVDPFVIGNFGYQSARDADKWANVPHTIKDGLPLLDNAAAYLRLRVVNQMEFATHTLFVCELADAEVGSNTAKPFIYGDYRETMKDAATAAFEKFKAGSGKDVARNTWRCAVCGYIYDGDVPFEELPDTWECPLCHEGKDAFEKV